MARKSWKLTVIVVAIAASVSGSVFVWKNAGHLTLVNETGEEAKVARPIEHITPPNQKPDEARQKSPPKIPQSLNETGGIMSAITDCRQSRDVTRCLEVFFREFFKKNATKTALQKIDELQKGNTEVRLLCHEIVHAVGRQTFAKEKTIHDSFTACDQTCHSGCYHGAMERFLRGEEDDAAPPEERAHLSAKEIEGKIVSACPQNEPVNFRFQCLHGLGHAVVFYFDYALKRALSACDNLFTAWDQASCWGGAFMENVHSATPEKRYLDRADYHFPCSVLDEKYKADCYVMQTTRMAEMGLSRVQIVNECQKAGLYRLHCLQSLGRDSSNDVRLGDVKSIVGLCEGIGDDDGTYACIKGTAYALSDNTWDGRYVFPFCALFTETARQRFCYQLSSNYLRTMLLATREKVKDSCSVFVKNDPLCLETLENF